MLLQLLEQGLTPEDRYEILQEIAFKLNTPDGIAELLQDIEEVLTIFEYGQRYVCPECFSELSIITIKTCPYCGWEELRGGM
jgi:rRNA maturation endonuclease Nob1